MQRATYPHAPVRSIQSLCRALAIPEPALLSIATRAPTLYIGPKLQPKKGGGTRSVYDTKIPLKPLLKKLNSLFLRRVLFPKYLTGSLAGRDFVANVEIHINSKRAITEDISQFFDYITAAQVKKIWMEFFNFSENVADVLTSLTTKDGKVCQGTPTSSYLANLAFWDREPALVTRLEERGFRYSRYVDDITVSAVEHISESDKRWAIAQIYGMIGAAGFKPKRVKHKGLSARSPITVMGLNANGKLQPTLTAKERAGIRAQVFQLEQRFDAGKHDAEFRSALRKAAGKAGRLVRLHKREGDALQRRLRQLQEKLELLPAITSGTSLVAGAAEHDDSPF